MDRGAALRRSSLVVFAVNFGLFAYKLIIGLYIHSYALISDSVNSFSDALVGLSFLVGIMYAYLPPDEEHAFGHGRAEYIVLFILSATLIGTGIGILGGEYFDFRHLTQLRYSTIYVVMIALTIPAKFFLGTYVARIGREKSASFLSADYWHEQSDNLVTGAVIVGILLSPHGFAFLDPLIGAAIAVFLIYLGFSYGRKSINQLMGGFQSNELIDRARKLSFSADGVRDVGDIEVHEYGERIVVNVTIVLSEDLDATSAHRISHSVQDLLTENGFYSAHVHVDTKRTNLLAQIEKTIGEIVSSYSDVLDFHGLVIRESLDTSVAEIHLVFEPGISLKRAHEIAHDVEESFRKKYPGYSLMSHLEPRKEADQ